MYEAIYEIAQESGNIAACVVNAAVIVGMILSIGSALLARWYYKSAAKDEEASAQRYIRRLDEYEESEKRYFQRKEELDAKARQELVKDAKEDSSNRR
ncbi:MAG: hypothetical protein FWB71_00785 [Defluviitaleaceae bacterium]|nr:hypothetical protein [Defluviitaleaceae bacterium]